MSTFSNLKHGVGSSKREVQEFVQSLKGRSPAEAMGIVARSHLLQALVISTVLQAAVLLASAGYSYVRRDTSPKPQPVAATQPTPATQAAQPSPTTAKAAAPAANNVTPVTTTKPDEVINKVMNTDIVKPEDQKGKGPRDVEDLLKGSR